MVYNLDEQIYFDLFSSFLSSLCDRCSTYEKVDKYRPPWPPHLVLMAKSVNKARRKYRRNRSYTNLQYFLFIKELFMDERSKFLHTKK